MLGNSKGFSLIEILIALFLGAMIYGLYQAGTHSGRKDLIEQANLLERSIRFSVDEAALKNALVRIHFLLDKVPHEYAVEYGPDDSFVLPTPRSSQARTLEEKERLEKITQNLNKKFNLVTEFGEKNRTLPENIRVVGIGSSLNKELTHEFHASIYVYPSGEKDSAIIILGSEDEVLAITINSFNRNIERIFRPFEVDNYEREEVESRQLEMAQELFNEWKRKK